MMTNNNNLKKRVLLILRPFKTNVLLMKGDFICICLFRGVTRGEEAGARGVLLIYNPNTFLILSNYYLFICPPYKITKNATAPFLLTFLLHISEQPLPEKGR